MWKHYLRMGSREVANSARALGYTTTADCRIDWLEPSPDLDGVYSAVGDSDYTMDVIEEAPWFDYRDESTSRFYGVYVIDVSGLTDSTRVGESTEALLDGGVVSRTRYAGRQVRVRVWLTARGLDALEAGMSWLSSTLAESPCLGDDCDPPELNFFSSAPDELETGGDLNEYESGVFRLRRNVREVTCISGPLTLQTVRSKDGLHYGREVEFTLYAGVPWIFGETRQVDLQPTTPIIVQDIAYNFVTHPSASLAGGNVVVATNLSTNPSAETNATGFVESSIGTSGSSITGRISSGRSTDVAADGSASFRVRLLGSGSSAQSGAATLRAYQDIDLTSIDPAARISFSVWGALLQFSGGAGSIVRLGSHIEWRNGSGLIRAESFLDAAAGDEDGHVFSAASREIPPGATVVRVYVEGGVLWESSTTPALNSDLRLYMDALAVTIP